MALSRLPPSARLCERIVSRSRMKPKVRARLTSLRKEVVEKSMDAFWARRLKIGWLNSISKLTLKPSNGSNCAHLPPSSTRRRFFTRMKRFRRTQLDNGVVDAETCECRQQMLHC